MRLRGILAARGVHFVATRFGPSWLRGMAFDEKYRGGDFKHHEHPEMVAVVAKYLKGGDLLLLGCGSAALAADLDPSAYGSILGVDLSEVAIGMAGQTKRKNVAFTKGDMLKFQCPHPYDVILFNESIYYVPEKQQVEILRRYSAVLKPGGVVMATIADPSRYHGILRRIRDHFSVVEDRNFTGFARHLIVFNSILPGGAPA